MPVPNKWVYVILLLFVVFLIWQDPGGAGTTARTFAGWIGNIVVSIFEFLDGLISPEGTPGSGTEPVPEPVTSGSQSGIDQFNPNPELN